MRGISSPLEVATEKKTTWASFGPGTCRRCRHGRRRGGARVDGLRVAQPMFQHRQGRPCSPSAAALLLRAKRDGTRPPSAHVRLRLGIPVTFRLSGRCATLLQHRYGGNAWHDQDGRGRRRHPPPARRFDQRARPRRPSARRRPTSCRRSAPSISSGPLGNLLVTLANPQRRLRSSSLVSVTRFLLAIGPR